MPSTNATSQTFIRTAAGAFVGAVASMICWIALFFMATTDDAAHWKGTLILTAVGMPILFVTGGVIVSRPYRNRLNYLVANAGVVLLATLLTSATIMTCLSLRFSTTSLLALPIFLVWTFVVERYLSATINSYVERLAGPLP